MKIKLITTPVIDCSGLMRSPQSDIGILYSSLKSNFGKNIKMIDYRFFYYDNFYDIYKKNLIFKKEDFFRHKEIISLVRGKIEAKSDFYLRCYYLYNSLEVNFKEINYLILPISIFEQFSLEYLLSALIVAYFFKKENKESKVIFFGTYKSIYTNIIMNNFDFVDAIIKKGDKDIISDIIKNFENNNNEILNNCIYRFGGKLISGLEYDVDINLDAFPDYTGFNLSIHKQKDNNLVLSYELGQGCRNNCFYCYNIHKGGNYVVKDIDKITSELEQLKEKYKTDLFHFDDNEINYSNSFLFELSNEIIKRKLNIYWTALIIPRDLSKQLLQKLYDAGCRQLRFGIESGSQKVLDIIGKKTKLYEIEEILKNCIDIGIASYATFIVDLPNETKEDIKKTIKFICNNRKVLNYIVICAYDTHLGTFDIKYFKYLLGKSDYDFDRTKRCSKKKILLRKICDKLGLYDVDVIQFMKYNIGKK